MTSHPFPKAPTILESLIWKVPRYGRKRRSRYLSRWFNRLASIEIANSSYDTPIVDKTMKSQLIIKLQSGHFESIEYSLLIYFKKELSKSVASGASEFMRNKNLPGFIEEQL